VDSIFYPRGISRTVSAPEIELALFAFGVAAFGALAGGIAGVGAVLVIAPLLYFGAPLVGTPLDFKAVSNLTTFSVLVSSVPAVWVYHSFGLVRREIVRPMVLPSALGALVGVGLAIVVSSAVVQAVFAFAAIAGAVLVLVPYHRSNDDLTRTLDVPANGLAATSPARAAATCSSRSCSARSNSRRASRSARPDSTAASSRASRSSAASPRCTWTGCCSSPSPAAPS
jgi:hypothetical protein